MLEVMLSSSSSSSRKLSENSCRSSNVGAYFGFIWAIIITLIIYYIYLINFVLL